MGEGRAYQSEIRASTVRALLQKAADRKYGKYLSKVVLKRLRGFVGEPVSFDFPVTAVIGPNGGGKTTVLGAAACGYKGVQPKRFFAKSGKYDESMQDWTIEYELIDRKLSAKDSIRRTASFKNRRWNRDALERDVLLFGVARTVPANERTELLRCASSKFNVPESRIEALSERVCTAVARILGKDITGFRRLKVDAAGRVVLLTGTTKAGERYSEFHFGAGESSIVRMVAQIELAEENTLVLIEEIENGLHPVATIRMVEYLIDVADRKKIQAIFTTHSNDALRPLPFKAIWVATQDRIFQGKLDIQSLRAITGQIEQQLIIFVEDSFARTWMEAVLRQAGGVAMDHIGVHAMEGDGTAVAVNRHHNKDPSVDAKSVCFIDGDSGQREDDAEGIFRLPGESPERYVFDAVLEKWETYGGKLAVALLQRFEDSDKVRAVCEDIALTNHDSHLIFSQVGQRLGLLPEGTVAAAFANIWGQAYRDDVEQILSVIRERLPLEQVGAA